MRKTQATLSHLEDLIAKFDYIVRYEKGNFNAGYCILNQKRIIVINKYFTTEGRISALVDILQELHQKGNIFPENLSEETDQKLLKQALNHTQ